MPEVFADVGQCVDAVLRRVGPRIVLALPLGIGKPTLLANEFYRRALRDSSIDLTILTALSLLKPVARSALEARLLTPLVARVFGSYVEPEYARAMHADTVPPNIRILEFFLTPGAFLNSRHAQRHYLSANYTHVARDALARGVNVIAHLVAQRSLNGALKLSLGSNTDVTVDLLPLIEASRAEGRDIVMVGQTHAQMPFMTGHALVDPGRFDFLVDDRRYDYDLFCPPNPPLGTVDHAIGVYASALVRDGGTLQIGIGELGDSLVYALLLRHQQNPAWRTALEGLGGATAAPLMHEAGGDAPFSAGLFACTEMFVDQLLELYRAGILRRRVYDSLPLERLLSSGQTLERFDERILGQLAGAGAGPVLSAAEFAQLKYHGVFREDVEFVDGRVRAAGGAWIAADLADPASRARLAGECLGRELRNGQVLHAGFFLGPRGFYAALRELPESERAQFGMRGVAFVNQLYGADQELRRRSIQLRRHGARPAGGTLDPVRARHPHAPRPHHLQHRVELRSPDHSAAPARSRGHRVRHRRPARPHRRGDHRGAPERRGLALSGRAALARPVGGQDPRRLPHPGCVPQQPATAPEARVARASPAGVLQRIPLRHGPGGGGDCARAGAEVSRRAHRERLGAPENRRGLTRCRPRGPPYVRAQAHGPRSAARSLRATAAAPHRAGTECQRLRGPDRYAASRPASAASHKHKNEWP